MDDFANALTAARSGLVRHCYRLVGSWAEAEELAHDALERALRARDGFRGASSVRRWLYTIATHAALNALDARRRRGLPSLEREPTLEVEPGAPDEPDRWITPAPWTDATETRESIALAFIALLQRLPPRQRAVLLLKDVVDFSAEEIATALELTVPSVNSALHRAREALQRAPALRDEPSPELVRALVQAWEARDLDRLVSLLRDDVRFSMPPWAAWFEGREAVRAFLASARFQAVWARLDGVHVTRANGTAALTFRRRDDAGQPQPHAILVAGAEGGALAEVTIFIGPAFVAGFPFSRT